MRTLVAALSTLALGTSACGTLFTESHALVSFQSDPPGAEVMIDGMPVGRTPVQAIVSNRRDHIVQFHMDGAAETTCLLTAGVGAGWVVLDVLFTGLIGVVVDAVTDGWSELAQGGCYARMGPAAAPANEVPLATRAE